MNGDIVNFTCTAIAFPAPYYNWTTPIPNTDFNTSTITIVVEHSYYGNYTCFAESNGTIAESQPALLTGSYVCYVMCKYVFLYPCLSLYVCICV